MFLLARRAASRLKQALFPKPAKAAWHKACREAARLPRYTPGRIRLLGYDLAYADLLTLCPQWEDIFVKETLRFTSPTESPRILDCGANVGLAALFFKGLYPRARVTAFEADPAIFALLKENLARNGAADVQAVHAAVWKAEGMVAFCCEGADSGALAELQTGVKGARREVPALRLRSLLEREAVDLLKLDIEGAEAEVLADCGPLLRRARALLMDLHEFRPQERRAIRVMELLEEQGFEYCLDEFNPLPWREPVAGGRSPFPGRALCWALLVRAWQRPPAPADGAEDARVAQATSPARSREGWA